MDHVRTEGNRPTDRPRTHRSGPVFIVGGARSGSSLLYRLLLEQTDFAPTRLTLEETHIAAHLPRAYGFRGTSPGNLYRYMLESDTHYGAFLRSTRYRRMVSLLLLGPHVVARRGYGTWSWDGSPRVLRSYFDAARQARGCTRIVEKSTDHALKLELLQRAFPNADFVYIHRHPTDVFSSYVRRARVDDASKPWAGISAEQFCQAYRASLQAVVRFAARSATSVHFVSYDSLVGSAPATLAALCAEIGAAYETPSDESTAYAGKTWAPDPLLFGPVTRQSKIWSDYIDRPTAKAIESELRDLMVAFGYTSRITTPSSQPD